jgi:hypothetical protein
MAKLNLSERSARSTVLNYADDKGLDFSSIGGRIVVGPYAGATWREVRDLIIEAEES